MGCEHYPLSLFLLFIHCLHLTFIKPVNLLTAAVAPLPVVLNAHPLRAASASGVSYCLIASKWYRAIKTFGKGERKNFWKVFFFERLNIVSAILDVGRKSSNRRNGLQFRQYQAETDRNGSFLMLCPR